MFNVFVNEAIHVQLEQSYQIFRQNLLCLNSLVKRGKERGFYRFGEEEDNRKRERLKRRGRYAQIR